MCFLPQLRCCRWRGLGSSYAWGGGLLGEERASGAPLGRNRTVATVKTGALDGLVQGYYFTSPAFRGTQGFASACCPPHCAMMSTASLTCCVVAAGPKVSTVHLTVSIRTWSCLKILAFLGLQMVICSSQLEELLPDLHPSLSIRLEHINCLLQSWCQLCLIFFVVRAKFTFS